MYVVRLMKGGQTDVHNDTKTMEGVTEESEKDYEAMVEGEPNSLK